MALYVSPWPFFLDKGAVHFSARNLQCHNFLNSSLNGISFPGINLIGSGNRLNLFPEQQMAWVNRKNSMFGHPIKALWRTLLPRWDTLYFVFDFIFLSDNISTQKMTSIMSTSSQSLLAHCTISETIDLQEVVWRGPQCRALLGCPKVEFFLIP